MHFESFTFQMSSDEENINEGHTFSKESFAEYNSGSGDEDSSSATLSINYNEESDPIFVAIDQYNPNLVQRYDPNLVILGDDNNDNFEPARLPFVNLDEAGPFQV